MRCGSPNGDTRESLATANETRWLEAFGMTRELLMKDLAGRFPVGVGRKFL